MSKQRKLHQDVVVRGIIYKQNRKIAMWSGVKHLPRWRSAKKAKRYSIFSPTRAGIQHSYALFGPSAFMIHKPQSR